jgi:hypothetical protein
MNRDKALRILLVLFGLIFVGGVYPLITSVRSGWQANKEDALPMGLSLYVTMGIFLLMAARVNGLGGISCAAGTRCVRWGQQKCQRCEERNSQSKYADVPDGSSPLRPHDLNRAW